MLSIRDPVFQHSIVPGSTVLSKPFLTRDGDLDGWCGTAAVVSGGTYSPNCPAYISRSFSLVVSVASWSSISVILLVRSHLFSFSKQPWEITLEFTSSVVWGTHRFLVDCVSTWTYYCLLLDGLLFPPLHVHLVLGTRQNLVLQIYTTTVKMIFFVAITSQWKTVNLMTICNTIFVNVKVLSACTKMYT